MMSDATSTITAITEMTAQMRATVNQRRTLRHGRRNVPDSTRM